MRSTCCGKSSGCSGGKVRPQIGAARGRDGQKELPFFDEAGAAPAEGAPAEGAETAAVAVAGHRRARPKRQPLPPELPRVEVVHDLPEAEQVCGCGGALSRIGEEVSEQLDVVPARVQVIRHIRPKYACRHCQGLESEGAAVRIAPLPGAVYPEGAAHGGDFAHVLTAKFADGCRCTGRRRSSGGWGSSWAGGRCAAGCCRRQRPAGA
jgi:hypothetical protein